MYHISPQQDQPTSTPLHLRGMQQQGRLFLLDFELDHPRHGVDQARQGVDQARQGFSRGTGGSGKPPQVDDLLLLTTSPPGVLTDMDESTLHMLALVHRVCVRG